jgi:hypothetical protein
MNESESGAKRAIIEQEETNISTTIEPNKKQKLSNEGLLQQQPEQQITPLPVIPNTALVLDKAQQDTINQLVQNTHVALPLEGKKLFKQIYFIFYAHHIFLKMKQRQPW